MRPVAPGRGAALGLALLLIGAAWLAALCGYRTPAARPADADAGGFSGARAQRLLRELVGDGVAHPIGSEADDRMRERIGAQLAALGLSPERQPATATCGAHGICGAPVNLVARLPAADGSLDHAVLLDAHYDSVPSGPGAADNGSGVAVALEIARILQQRPRCRQAIILLFDEGEEADLLGAWAFVRQHPWAASVTAAVNLDARGSSGASLMFETGSANRWLMERYAAAVARPLSNSLYYAIYRLLPNDTNFTVFRAAGYQGYNFAFIDDVAHYHTPLDRWANVDPGSLQQQGDNALATLLALADAAPQAAAPGEAVYFDLWGRALVRLPRALMLPAAIAMLSLLLIVAWRLMQSGRLAPRALAFGLLGLAGALAAAGLLAIGLLLSLRGLGVLSLRGASAVVAHPWALQGTFSALALLILTATGRLLARRAGLWGLTAAGGLLYALLGVVLAAALAGGSYLALLPALALLLVLLIARRPAPAAVALCLVSGVLVLPLLVPLYLALGNESLPLLCVALVYAGAGLAGLIADVPPGLQRAAIAAAASAWLAGLCAALALPAHTPDQPLRLDLEYRLEADGARAQWIAAAGAETLPAALRALAPFVRAVPALPAGSGPEWSAPAPPLPLPGPQLRVLALQTTGPGRVRYRLHLASARAGARLTLLLPPQAQAGSFEVEATGAGSARGVPARIRGGWRQWQWFGALPQGCDLSIETAAVPFEVVLEDRSFELPPQGRALQQSRPRWAVPSQDGDVTVVARRYRLPG